MLDLIGLECISSNKIVVLIILLDTYTYNIMCV